MPQEPQPQTPREDPLNGQRRRKPVEGMTHTELEHEEKLLCRRLYTLLTNEWDEDPRIAMLALGRLAAYLAGTMLPQEQFENFVAGMAHDYERAAAFKLVKSLVI